MNRGLAAAILACALPLFVVGCDRELEPRIRAVDLLKRTAGR